MGIKGARLWFPAAFVWGFAEATFFFIVPDLVLTAAVLALGFRPALRLAVTAAAGAVIGGLMMWGWGVSDAAVARDFLLSVPLLGEDLLARVQAEMGNGWPVNLAIGALTGAPYKIYAVEAGAAAINPAGFAIVSFVARLARFGLAISITAAGRALAVRLGLARLAPFGLAFAWLVIYVIYLRIRLNA